MIRRWGAYLGLRLALWIFSKHAKHRGACSNRYYLSFKWTHLRYRLVITDTREPTHYSREELVQMLHKVRKAEAGYLDGWKVPEPQLHKCANCDEYGDLGTLRHCRVCSTQLCTAQCEWEHVKSHTIAEWAVVGAKRLAEERAARGAQ